MNSGQCSPQFLTQKSYVQMITTLQWSSEAHYVYTNPSPFGLSLLGPPPYPQGHASTSKDKPVLLFHILQGRTKSGLEIGRWTVSVLHREGLQRVNRTKVNTLGTSNMHFNHHNLFLFACALLMQRWSLRDEHIVSRFCVYVVVSS